MSSACSASCSRRSSARSGDFEIEGGVLRGELGFLVVREVVGGLRRAAADRHDRSRRRSAAIGTQEWKRAGHSVIDWMNFLVMLSSALRCAMSTLRSVSISRMFSLRSFII